MIRNALESPLWLAGDSPHLVATSPCFSLLLHTLIMSGMEMNSVCQPCCIAAETCVKGLETHYNVNVILPEWVPH